jgi:hypothetical protein
MYHLKGLLLFFCLFTLPIHFLMSKAVAFIDKQQKIKQILINLTNLSCVYIKK